jgi:hypothetical protein
MIGKVCTILLSGFLVVAASCGSKSEVTQQSTATQPSPSPQQSAPAPAGSGNAPNEQQQNTSADAGSTGAKLDACALLTSDEIKEVQGEAVKETKSNARSSASFAISQCFYTLPTFVKSVSLEVTRSDPADKNRNATKEFWKERFHKSAEKKADRDSEEEKERGKGKEEEARGKDREEEEEKESPPQPVSGVGEEAFWLGNRVAGALYVLKNNSILRISIGGPGDASSKIEKSKALAQKAIKRL